LIAIYQRYDESKLNYVDQVLLDYKGKEEELFRELAKKYSIDLSFLGLSTIQSSSTGFKGGGRLFGQATPLSIGVGNFGHNGTSSCSRGAAAFGTATTSLNFTKNNGNSNLEDSKLSFGEKKSSTGFLFGASSKTTIKGGFGSLVNNNINLDSSNNNTLFGGLSSTATTFDFKGSNSFGASLNNGELAFGDYRK